MLHYAQLKLSRLVGLDGNSKKHSTSKTTASVLAHSFRDPIQVDLVFLPEEYQQKSVEEILADDSIKLTLVEGHDRTLNVCRSLFKSDPENPPGNIDVVRKRGKVVDWLIPATVAKSDTRAKAVAYSIDHNATTVGVLGEESILDIFHHGELFGQVDELLTEGESLTSFDLDLDTIANMLLAERDDELGLDDVEEVDDGDDEPEDETDEPIAVESVCEEGDLWQVGRHRVLVGDARSPESWKILLGSNKANIVFTSPPYASQRKYDPDSGFKPIKPDDFSRWYYDCQSSIFENLEQNGSYFLNIKEHCQDGERHLYVKQLVIEHVLKWGWHFVDELCWLRNPPPGKWPNRFKNAFEPVFHFAHNPTGIKFLPDNVAIPSSQCFDSDTDKRNDVANGTHWNMPKTDPSNAVEGLALPSNVIDIRANPKNLGHQAAFPSELPEFFIKAYSDLGDIVVDPFAGSGSTLHAAHNAGRIGYGIELSPSYADIILARLANLTGETPAKLN